LDFPESVGQTGLLHVPLLTELLERATRIELAFSAWEADVLPLNYARVATIVVRMNLPPTTVVAR
jgi:hypothetical protein